MTVGSVRCLRRTATTIAFETKSKRDLDAQNSRLKNLERQAEEALKAGNEKLARRALQLQVEAKATRERADAYALASQEKTAKAYANGKLQPDLVPVAVRDDEGAWHLATVDEAPRETSLAALASMFLLGWYTIGWRRGIALGSLAGMFLVGFCRIDQQFEHFIMLQQNAQAQLGGIGDLTRIVVYPGFSEGGVVVEVGPGAGMPEQTAPLNQAAIDTITASPDTTIE